MHRSPRRSYLQRMTGRTRALCAIILGVALTAAPHAAHASGGGIGLGGGSCPSPVLEGMLLEFVSLEVDGAAVEPARVCTPKLNAVAEDDANFLPGCGGDERHFYARR